MILIDRRYLRYFDWISFSLIAVLSAIGLLFVYSATYLPDAPYSLFFKKQLFGILSGFIIYLIFSIVDYRSLNRWGYFIYFIILVLLFFTIIKGSIGMGAQRWISLGLFRFQPSELAKLFLPSFISYYLLTQNDTAQYTLSDFLPIIALLGMSFMLILKQPDLGTALLIVFSGFTLLWFAGISKRFIVICSVIFLISAPLTWRVLKPYQKKRILVFLGQGAAHKERYQIEQSKIAIGSGGLCGKGITKGTQNIFQFLPESRTDFIFSVIAEEWGFLGVLLVITLYIILFFRLMIIASSLNFLPTILLALGLIIHCIFSCIINMAMVTGLLPIVGIPLPLLSYGISHLWITFASFGWFNSIAIRRFYTGIAK